jgi:hypothetical protein
LEESAVHDPPEKYPRLEIMIGIAPDEGSNSADKEPNLWREVLVVDLFDHHEG